MMATLRLYGPMILLLFWAAVFAVVGGSLLAVIALVSISGSVKVQVDENRRQRSK